MDKIVRRELEEGIISISVEKPQCIHALGEVPKANGGMRPIRTVVAPLNNSVNNFCDSLFKEFKYKSIDDAVNILEQGDYMSVVDIKSAYRAVPMMECHRKYMGFR